MSPRVCKISRSSANLFPGPADGYSVCSVWTKVTDSVFLSLCADRKMFRLNSPERPPYIEAHDVQPEEGSEQSEVFEEACKESEARGHRAEAVAATWTKVIGFQAGGIGMLKGKML